MPPVGRSAPLGSAIQNLLATVHDQIVIFRGVGGAGTGLISIQQAIPGLRFGMATFRQSLQTSAVAMADTKRNNDLLTTSTSILKNSQSVLSDAMGKHKDGIVGSTLTLLQDVQISKQLIAEKQNALSIARQASAMNTTELTARQQQVDNLEKVKKQYEKITGLDEQQKEAQEELRQRKDLRVKELAVYNRRLQDAVAAGTPTSAIQRSITTIETKIKNEKLEESQISVLYTEQINDTKSALQKLTKKYNDSVDEEDKLNENITDTASGFAQLEAKLKQTTENAHTLNEKSKDLAVAEEKAAIEVERTKINEIFNPLKKYIGNVGAALTSLTTSLRETQQQFGLAADQAAQLKVGNVIASITSYVDSLKSGFSTVAVSAEQIAKTQADFQDEFGGVLTSDAAKALTEEATRLGITTKQMAQARRVFMTQSMGDLAGAERQFDKAIAQFKQNGLTAKDAMQAVEKYSELYARNGIRFADALNRAAGDAKKIGVDLDKVDQFGDSIIGDFEGFLEKQAELGAMGFGFDTNRLAQIAESGDTGALFQELRSQLAATGKDITNLRRSEQLALSNAFGIPMSQLQRMAAGGAEGSGEELLTDQQQGNKTLLQILNALSVMGGLLGGISTILGVVHSALLWQIANKINVPGMGAGSALAAAGKFGAGAAGLGVGIGGALMGRDMVKEGNVAGGVGLGTIAGLAGGALLSIATGGAALPFLLAGGALAGGGIAASGMLGDDVISQAGYGERSLVTPTGVVALNNQDNIVSYADDMVSTNTGLQMLSKGSIAENARTNTPQQVNVDMSALENKLDQVVRAISGMHVSMDSTKVGKVLINNSDTAGSVGVMGIQNLQTF